MHVRSFASQVDPESRDMVQAIESMLKVSSNLTQAGH